ncbi:MAG: S1C family serine protease [Acidimicrobiales bacterium]
MSGDTPEDSGMGADGPDHGDESPDPIRGWISPDDRLWRHPSEAASARPATGDRAAVGDRNRPSPWIVGGAAACVAGALLASGLVLATSGASPDVDGHLPATTATSLALVTAPPTTEPGAANLAGLTPMDQMAVTVRPSLAALTVTRPSGVSMATGVIAESGGIIATAAAAIAGARSISFDGSDGSRDPAELVGSDPASGIAVLRVASDLPVANFDSTDPVPGSTMMAVAMHPGSGSGAAPRSSVYAGAVRSSGTAVGTGSAGSGFSVTTAALPLSDHDRGCALLSAQGLVSGLLDSTQTDGDTTVGVFLPAELVLGVTRQLVAAGTVERGWLGIEASDIDGTTGATVTGDSPSDGATLDAVDAQGAAAQAGLQIGDVIVGIDGGAVHSTAELRTRLYADLPGTTVVVAIDRGGTPGTTTAVLTASQSNASAADSSP